MYKDKLSLFHKLDRLRSKSVSFRHEKKKWGGGEKMRSRNKDGKKEKIQVNKWSRRSDDSDTDFPLNYCLTKNCLNQILELVEQTMN